MVAAIRKSIRGVLSPTELLPDAAMEAGSAVKFAGNSRTGTAPSTSVAAAEFKSSLVSPMLLLLL